MNIWLRRFSSKSDTTLGLLFLKSEFECYTLEDEHRDEKVIGMTRIPAGYYEVKKREVLSPLTQRYRDRFDWFDFHLEIQDVPDFNYVYIHIGNDDDDTDACVLVGDQQVNNKVTQHNNLLSSTPAFERVYKKISNALSSGSRVMIKITDK